MLDKLLPMQEEAYRAMQCRIIPNIDPETIIGVRTPLLREIAKQLPEKEAFLQQLPHRYFEENQIHAFLLERGKDFEETVHQVERFLPYVDNWATCDQLRPRIFARHHRELLPYIERWLHSDQTYTVRFGMGMLMTHFLDGDFQPEYLQWVIDAQREEYYVRMMAAWYFATALAKQYEAAKPYIVEYRLEKWTHNKAIQKSVESYRITPEQKAELKSYRLR